jgi:hypothetical protein
MARTHETTDRQPTDSWLQRLRRPEWALPAQTRDEELRGRRRDATIASLAFTGGVICAGFGLTPALLGAVAGGVLGYLYERHEDTRSHHQAL